MLKVSVKMSTSFHSIEDEDNKRLYAQIEANNAKKSQRLRLRDAAKSQIQLLIDRDEKLILEINERIRVNKEEQNNIDKGLKDDILTSSIVSQAEQIQHAPIAPARPERPQSAQHEKRVRKTVHRIPLCDLIKSRLNFKWEGYTCHTDNGNDFVEPDGTIFRSLNSWTEAIIERRGGGGRKVSVYVVVDVQNNATGEWKNWGQVYTGDCTSLVF
jgi:hypothetical protein